MTDTYPSAPPPAPRPDDEEARTPAPHEAAPENAAPPAPSVPSEAPQPTGGHVWSPPVPQFPARPSQAPPVQYTGPQTAPVPQYVPPQPPPNPQQYAPQAAPQQGQYATAQMYAPPQQVYAPPPSPRMSRARVGRRFMRRAVTGGSGVGKLFGGARLPITLLTLALIGVITWLAIDRAGMQSALASAKPNAVAPGAIVLPREAPSVTTYLAATRSGNLEDGWNTLSPKLKEDRVTIGDDKTVMKDYLEQLQTNNVVPNYRFVGAYGKTTPTDFSKGGTYYYMQEVAVQGRSLSQPMVFVVDENDRITYVFDFLYLAVAEGRSRLPPTR